MKALILHYLCCFMLLVSLIPYNSAEATVLNQVGAEEFLSHSTAQDQPQPSDELSLIVVADMISNTTDSIDLGILPGTVPQLTIDDSVDVERQDILAAQLGISLESELLVEVVPSVQTVIESSPISTLMEGDPLIELLGDEALELGILPVTVPEPRSISLHQLFLPVVHREASATADASVEQESVSPEIITNSGSASVQSVRTTDRSNNPKTNFSAGESIRYWAYVVNSTGAARTVSTVWSLSTPCGSGTLYSGNINTGTGTQYWAADGAVPSNCPGSYTFTMKVTYNGQTSSKSSTFTVSGGGSGSGGMSVQSVRTTDRSNNPKTNFSAGEGMRYGAYVVNSTGATRTVSSVWSLSTPCGSGTLYSGNINPVSGTQYMYAESTVPNNCPGSYTFTVKVTYNGQTSSKSSTFTVSGGNVSMHSVRTTDRNDNPKTNFSAGEGMRYGAYIVNSTGATRTVSSVWSLSTPCGSGTLYSGNINPVSGTQYMYAESTVPNNCPGSYTFTVKVTYNGQTSSKSSTFTVSGGGSMSMHSVRTTDRSNNPKTNFSAGEGMRYGAYIINSTGATRTVSTVWSLSTPCGSVTLYSGNINTGTGTHYWSADGAAPSNCPGSYTFTVKVTYNGQTSSKSSAFTISGGGSGSGGMSVQSVRTTDRSNNPKTNFSAGEGIRYGAYIINSTGATRTVSSVWSLSTPCGSVTLYSGNINTGTGTHYWAADGTAPSNCLGSYTFTVNVTYNGQTSSKSSTFTVGASGIAYRFDFPLDEGGGIIGYDIMNSNLSNKNSECYNKKMSEIWHAGEDWFVAANTPVKAVADGIVVFADPTYSYPGRVIIIKHALPDSSIVYSMYGHLGMINGSVFVGANVVKGATIGTVLDQGNNTHLHWEIRTFEDGSLICNRSGKPGPGYTYPDRPGAKGYLNPSEYIRNHR